MISFLNTVRFLHFWVLITYLCIPAQEVQGSTLNATSIVTSASFMLSEGTSNQGYKLHYNTYDGVSGYSRSQTSYGGEVILANGAYNFRTDYDVYITGRGPHAGYAPVGYGTMAFSIPTTDTDGDGQIDFLDRSREFKSSVSGTLSEFITSVGVRNLNFTCTFNRGSNTEVGTYTIVSGSVQITGFFFLKYGRANVIYDTENKTITFQGTAFGYGSPFSAGNYGAASSTYEILSPTSIRVNAFTYANSYDTLNVNSFVMTRSGNKFVTSGSMQDGSPFTPWIDYKNFFLIVTDNNDTDTDGIPDLADDLIFLGPTITTEPQPAVISQGAAVDFTVAASSPYTITYQWYYNNSIMEGKTSSTLTLNNVQAAQAGNYKVVVTSNSKSKTSQTAVLTVQVTPRITLDPVGITIVAGRTLTLTAGASGTPTPTYEWYRDNSLINGQSGATLTVNNITLAQGGDYKAKAINPAGNATTAIAKVTVTTGVFAAPQNVTAAHIQSSGFPLDLQLENGNTYRLEYSTDLVSWQTLTTFTSTGTTKQHLDAAAASNPRRFYRLVKP